MADTLGPTLLALLEEGRAALDECSRPVGLVTLAPGASVAWDNCCEQGGELWGRVIMLTPQQDRACDITHFFARVGLGVIRCVATLNDEGEPPSAAHMTADTIGMTRDADTLLHAVRHWAPNPNLVPHKSIRVEQGTPLGPSGGCGGWEWTVTFNLMLCEGCDED